MTDALIDRDESTPGVPDDPSGSAATADAGGSPGAAPDEGGEGSIGRVQRFRDWLRTRTAAQWVTFGIVTETGTDAMGGREVNTFEQLPNGAVRFTITFSIDLPDEAKDGVEFIEKSGRDEYKIEQAAIKKALES